MSFLRPCTIVLACISFYFAAIGTAISRDSGDKTPGFVPLDPDTSSPDLWGYTWVRSTDPGGPTYNWVDIESTGTRVLGLGDDNFVGPIPILFDFPYYWYTVPRFWIGSNGYINFSSPANFAPPFAQLPNTTAPNDLLAILVGDLDFTNVGANPRCYYWSNGVDSLVVSYIDVGEWESPHNPNTRHTFQVILLKADSSIIFQYGRQQGRFNSQFNTRLCIGWENQTGQIGLSYTYNTVPPHPLHPDSGLAIRIKRTVNTGLQITDAGILGGFSPDNLGKILRTGVADTIKAYVKNFGTVNLSNVRVTYAISRAGQSTARDTVFISSMLSGEEAEVVFPRLFTVAPIAAGTWTATFTTTVAGDQGPGNNTKIAEVVAVPFSTLSNTQLSFDEGVSGGSINWIGGGGMAMSFGTPLPVRIESVSVQIAAVTNPQLTVDILSDSNGGPGSVRATRTVTAIVGDNRVSFVSDSLLFPNGKFFVSGRGQMAFAYATVPPISYRSWEYTNGYAPYRSRDIQDVMIRAVVRYVDTTTVGVGDPGDLLPASFALDQNYPNPFNPTTEIRYALPTASFVTIKVYTLLGQEVTALMSGDQVAGYHLARWDGRNTRGEFVGSGMYFYRLEAKTDNGSAFISTKKMLFIK